MAYLARIVARTGSQGADTWIAVYRIVSKCIWVALIGIHSDTLVSPMYRVCIVQDVSIYVLQKCLGMHPERKVQIHAEYI